MENFPSTARFLNRLLALPIDQQNDLYEAFATILKDHFAALEESGTLNVGIETLSADSFSIQNTEEIYHHQETGAKAWSWTIERKDKYQPFSDDQASNQYCWPDHH